MTLDFSRQLDLVLSRLHHRGWRLRGWVLLGRSWGICAFRARQEGGAGWRRDGGWMERRRAFLVTEGEYSDYTVQAVFDDEELATAWRDAYCQGGKVEEFELNPLGGELRAGLRRWLVRLWRHGDVQEVAVHDFEGAPADRWAWATVSFTPLASQRALGRLFDRLEPALCFEVHLVASDELTAVKAANERRARSLAAGEADAVSRHQEVPLYWHDIMQELERRGIWGGTWLVKHPDGVVARNFPTRSAAVGYIDQSADRRYLWAIPELDDAEA